VTLVDLGVHRLGDLSEPLRVFQVEHPRLENRFPPLRALTAFPGNLPLPVSSFVGRDRERADAIEALAAARVVTLTGTGGVGKTRLALRVAGEVLPRFGEAWLVELAPMRDGAGVVGAVAAALGVSARPGMTLAASLVEFLRARRLLLVVDNCEHVLDAVGELLGHLAGTCPGVVVLATSREGLGIEGERLLPVPPLAGPAGDSDSDVASSEAVRLFVERAQSRDPQFTLTAPDIAPVAEICRRLDGLPLAIELAAAQITVMNPGELATVLDRRLDLLGGGHSRTVRRHQTLRATIDWSYERLDESQRRLLARLSVFAGGCTREAAETVCGWEPLESENVFGCLAVLVAQSLVVAERDRPQTRYRLLETIRDYAEQRLAQTGETAQVRDRHAVYYAAFADQFWVQAWGPGQVTWGRRLLAERDNLMAGWARTIESDDLDAALRICRCDCSDVQIGHQLSFPTNQLLTVRDAAGHPDYPFALAFAASHAASSGDHENAQRWSELALDADAAADLRDPRVDVYVTIAFRTMSISRGDLVETARLSERYVDDACRAGLPTSVIAIAKANAANMRTVTGNCSGAVGLAEEALNLARSNGMPSAICVALLALGTAIVDTDPTRARSYLEESLQTSASLGYEQSGELQASAILASRLRDRRTTIDLAGRAIGHLQATGDRTALILMLDLGAGALKRARPETAAIMHGTAEAIRQTGHGDPQDLSGPLAALGPAGSAAFRLDDAIAYARAQISAALADPDIEL
jgi:predicted ATPase